MQTLKNKIMRRVWYSYTLSIMVSRFLVQGFALGVSLVLFFRLVSVPHLIQNLLNVKLGSVPEYIWQTLEHAVLEGEILKLLTLGVIVFSLLTFRFNFKPVSLRQTQHV